MDLVHECVLPLPLPLPTLLNLFSSLTVCRHNQKPDVIVADDGGRPKIKQYSAVHEDQRSYSTAIADQGTATQVSAQ